VLAFCSCSLTQSSFFSTFNAVTPASEYNDKALFARLSQDDEEAFTQLFHAYTPKLFPFVNKLMRNEHIAQEMIQETFLRLWMNRSELVKVDDPAAWIFRIAANVSITWLRKQSNRQRLLDAVEVAKDTTADYIVENLETKELTLVINKAVNALPERRKEIYRLSREQGLSHQQIAEQLHLSASTVANQIGISLKFIREFISKETGLSILTLLMLFSR
jgi:RNA polymerase sigma-70 factor (family 1)